MSTTIYRYEFDPTVNTKEAQETLLLALVATESLHGETATQLELSHYFDAERRVCVIEANGDAGRAFNALFTGFLRQEFGTDSFEVRRVNSCDLSQTTAA